jgi:two-component system, cell cycle response regulator DivK
VSLVLIVDDNEVNRYLAQFLLENAGFEVQTAGSGAQALAAAHAQRPDLVLMDIRMPVMDGHETTSRLKADASLCDVPVVALSAHALPHEKVQAMQSGCSGYIEKPIDAATFVDQVRAVMTAPQASPPRAP